MVNRQQTIGFHRPLLAVEVEVFDGDPLGAPDLCRRCRHRQAAFFADLLSPPHFSRVGLRSTRRLFFFRHVDDHDALVISTWRRRQPMPGASYMVFWPASATSFRMLASICDRLRHPFQAYIGKTQNEESRQKWNKSLIA